MLETICLEWNKSALLLILCKIIQRRLVPDFVNMMATLEQLEPS
jgi:hypothetical protein